MRRAGLALPREGVGEGVQREAELPAVRGGGGHDAVVLPWAFLPSVLAMSSAMLGEWGKRKKETHTETMESCGRPSSRVPGLLIDGTRHVPARGGAAVS